MIKKPTRHHLFTFSFLVFFSSFPFSTYAQEAIPIALNDTMNIPYSMENVRISEYFLYHVTGPYSQKESWIYDIISQSMTNKVLHYNGSSYEYFPDFSKKLEKLTFQVCNYNTPSQCDTADLVFNLINNPVIAKNDDVKTSPNAQICFNPFQNDYDPDGLTVVPGYNFDVTVVKSANRGITELQKGEVSQYRFCYTADSSFIGTDSIVYQICDKFGLCDTAVIYLEITNQAPVAKDDSTTISFKKSSINVSNNDSDVDENLDLDSYKIVKLPKGRAAFSLSEYQKGTIDYTPPKGFSGTDTLSYSVCDKSRPALCDTSSVFITVLANNAPITQPTSFNSIPFVNISYSLNNEVSVNDPEGELDTTSFKLIKAPRYCDFKLNPNGLYQAYVRTPNVLDTAIYSICDINGLCTEGYIYMEISQSKAPKANDQDVFMSKNQKINSYLLIDDLAFNFDSLTAIKILNPASNIGNFNWNLKKEDYRIYFNYTPKKDFIGLDTIRYKVCDSEGLCDSALLTFKVVENERPTAVNDEIKLTGTYAQGDAQTNDFDINYNLDSISYRIVYLTKKGDFSMNWWGGFQYNASPGFTYRDTASYQVCDKLGLCDTALIIFIKDSVKTVETPTYTNVRRLAMLKNTTLPITDLLKPSGIQFSSRVMCVSRGDVGINNDVVFYTPNLNFVGLDTVCIQICNELGLCDTTICYISILDSGNPPVANNLFISMVANTSYVGISTYDANNGSPLTVSYINVSPLHGTATMSQTGVISYTPAPNFFGTDELGYRICNAFGCDSALVKITVQQMITTDTLPKKSAPTATNDNFETTKNTPLRNSVATNDFDVDNDLKINGFKALATTTNGVLTFNTNGSFVYTPNQNYVGLDTAIYSVCDSANLCDTASILFTVKDINVIQVKHAPNANNDYFTTEESTTLSNSVATNDTDADNDLKINSFKLLKTTQNGNLTFKNNGDFNYTPNPNFAELDTATYSVCDTTGLCDTALLVITVKKVYHAPSLEVDIFNNAVNSALHGSVALNDTDIDGDLNKTSFKIGENPKRGNVKLAADGQFIYLPKFNYLGKDTFTYTACDTRGACSKTSCIITTKGLEVSGRMFIDENRDGIINANEIGVANVQIQITSTTSVFTNETGFYALLIDTSKTYNLTPNFSSTVFNLQNKTITVKSSSEINQVIENQNFRIVPKALISDLAISFEQGNARPGFSSASVLTFSNKGTTTLRGTLKVKLDAYLSFEMADKDPLSVNGNALSWYFADLKPFEVRRINIISKTAVRTPLDYETTINFSGLPNNFNDNDTSNNAGVSKMQVRGSFDPNDIKVDITKVNQFGNLKEMPVALTYTIRFQNTGNAEAYRVEVVDTLSEKLDIATIEMVAASHPFEMLILKDNSSSKSIVKWVFDNINLVDSTTKEACSHGFVKYRINNAKSKTNYAKDSILNKAAIYFDFNDPVSTDTATTFFNLFNPTQELNSLKFQAFPNPTADWVNLNFDKDMDGIIETHNVYGQLINSQILRGSNGQVNLSKLSAGIYYITVKSDKKQGTVKVVKR
jgi:hypothetical protein